MRAIAQVNDSNLYLIVRTQNKKIKASDFHESILHLKHLEDINVTVIFEHEESACTNEEATIINFK